MKQLLTILLTFMVFLGFSQVKNYMIHGTKWVKTDSMLIVRGDTVNTITEGDTLLTIEQWRSINSAIKSGYDSSRFNVDDGYIYHYISGNVSDSTGLDGRYRPYNDSLFNCAIGEFPITSKVINVNYGSVSFSDSSYHLILSATYNTIDDGDIIPVQMSIHNPAKTPTGFSCEVDSIIGTFTYLAADSTGLSAYSGGASEVDPVFTSSTAYGITESDTSNWNSKATIDTVRYIVSTIPTGGVKSWYFTNTASDIGGYYLAQDTIPTTSIQSITSTATDGESLVAQFMTPREEYRVTDGYRFFYLNAKVSDESKNVKLRGEIYTCDTLGNNQVLLRTSSVSSELTESMGLVSTNAYGGSLLIPDTLRVVFKIIAIKGDPAGTDPTVTLYVSDNTFTRLDVPVPIPAPLFESDPTYSSDSSYIKSSIRDFAADSSGWNAKAPTIFIAASNATMAEKLKANYICDGNDDDIDINAAISSLPTDGGAIVFSTGLFLTSNSILANKRISIRGVGSGYATGGDLVGITTIRATGSYDVLKITSSRKLRGCSVRDLHIQGNSVTNGYAALYTDSTDVLMIDNVHCINSTYSFYCRENDAGTMIGCSGQNSQLGLYLNQCYFNRIISCTFADNSGNITTDTGGAYLYNCYSSQLSNSVFVRNGYNNIVIEGNNTAECSIVNNTIFTSNKNSIRIGNSNYSAIRNIIANNFISKAGESQISDERNGIKLAGAKFTNICNNIFGNSGSNSMVNAIYEYNSGTGMVKGNIATNNSYINLQGGVFFNKVGSGSIDFGNIEVGESITSNNYYSKSNLVFGTGTTSTPAPITIETQNGFNNAVVIPNTGGYGCLTSTGTQAMAFRMSSGNVFQFGDILSVGSPISFLIKGSTKVYISSTSGFEGNVGIGTTAPDKKLEINQPTAGSAIRISYNDANGSAADYFDLGIESDGDGTLSTASGDSIKIDRIVKVSNDLIYDVRHGFYEYNPDYTPAVTQNVYTKITPTFTTIENSNLTFAGDTITIISPGDYVYFYTFTLSDGVNSDFTIQLRKNNATVKTVRHSTAGTGEYSTITLMYYLKSLVAGDDLSLYVTNTVSSDDPIFSDQSIYIRKEH